MDTRKYCIDNSILSCSFNLSYDGKKKVYEAIAWSKITTSNLKTYHNYKKNGFMILTGSKNKIVVLDCDIGKSQGLFPQDLLDYLDSCCKSIVKTPNGKHYYFSYSGIIKKQTGAYWKGKKVEWFDILAEKASIISPPSNYIKNDDIVSYNWIEGNLSTLVDLPDELVSFIEKPTYQNNQVNDIETILDNISIERWKDYTIWINIGMILKSEGYSLELWDTYSKKAPNYQSGCCRDKWNSFLDNSSLTIATLYYYLKEDNYEVFISLKSGLNIIDCLLDFTHQNYAKLFYISNPDNYIFISEIGWFSLMESNTWSFSKKHPNLKLQIADFIYRAIDKYCPIDDGTDEVKNIIRLLGKAKNNIKTKGFSDSVISWVEEYYSKKLSFFDNFDSKRNLLAFADGKVFDIDINNFRDIEPEDYITITTKYPAPPLDLPVEKRLEDFLYSLFEDEEQTKYFLRTISYSLFGDRRHQEIYILDGAGGNGKGLVINMLLEALGNYTRNLPSTYITKPSDGKDGALPTLADAKSCRILYTSELEVKDILQTGFLKSISGGDILTVRKLHCPPIPFLPQFNLFTLCNGSKLSKVDLAVKRRLRLHKFPFQFVENPLQENERLIDKTLGDYTKTKDCIDSLLSLLLRIYIDKVKDKDSLLQSKASKIATEEYLSENNPISSWLFENYNTKASSDDRITTKELVKDYCISTSNKMTSNEMNTFLSALGFIEKRSGNLRQYWGIKKKEQIILE